MSQFTIKEDDLAAALEISPDRLDEVIEFFDSDPNDEWELKQSLHYVYTNKTWGNRIFSEQGAFAIGKYLRATEPVSLWDKLREFITGHKQKIQYAFVGQKIHENSSSLMRRGDRHFLSRRDVIAILSTHGARLNAAIEDIRQSDRPLEFGADYDDIDGKRYYSFSGIYRLSQNLSETLTKRDRREWCAAVDIAGKTTLTAIAASHDDTEKSIARAMRRTRKRDKETCQITGKKKTKRNHGFNLASHHLYSRQEYPHLAAVEDNLITLDAIVHAEFHAWNGGSQKPCSPHDLIAFICERYPYAQPAVARLNQVANIFNI